MTLENTDLTTESSVSNLLDTLNVSSTVREVITLITKANSMDVANIVMILEKVFGVSAAPVSAGPQGGAEAEVKEEKNSFQIKLVNVDSMTKLGAVKVIRTIFTEMSLKDASDLLKNGVVLEKNFNKAEAEDMIKQFSANNVVAEKI